MRRRGHRLGAEHRPRRRDQPGAARRVPRGPGGRDPALRRAVLPGTGNEASGRGAWLLCRPLLGGQPVGRRVPSSTSASRAATAPPRGTSPPTPARRLGMERDRLLIQTDDGLGLIVGLLIHLQNVFHFADVLGVELRNAPHFFPATASSHGCSTTPGWFRVQPAAPTFA